MKVPASGKEALAAAKRARGRDLDLLDMALSCLGGAKFDAARDEVRARLSRRSKGKQRKYGVKHTPSGPGSRGPGGRR